MSRKAKLYLLDEPIGGVDPATRDFILNTIISNYNPEAAVVISTHLIADVENILDDVAFLNRGHLLLQSSADELRAREGKSVDAVFRESDDQMLRKRNSCAGFSRDSAVMLPLYAACRCSACSRTPDHPPCVKTRTAF